MSQVTLTNIPSEDHTFAIMIASCHGYIDTVMLNSCIYDFRTFEGLHPKEPKRSEEFRRFYMVNDNNAFAARLKKVFNENKDAFPTVDKLIIDPNFAKGE